MQQIENMDYYDEVTTTKDALLTLDMPFHIKRYYVGNRYFTGVPCKYFDNKNKALEYLNFLNQFGCFDKEELFLNDFGSIKEVKERYHKLGVNRVKEELRQGRLL